LARVLCSLGPCCISSRLVLPMMQNMMRQRYSCIKFFLVRHTASSLVPRRHTFAGFCRALWHRFGRTQRLNCNSKFRQSGNFKWSRNDPTQFRDSSGQRLYLTAAVVVLTRARCGGRGKLVNCQSSKENKTKKERKLQSRELHCKWHPT
jgi:hypothetical protein